MIKEAHFSTRCDNEDERGRLGYGCKQGSMHLQGVVTYFYNHVYPGKGHGVELDVYVWNQVGHRDIYQGNKTEWNGMCQQSPIFGGNVSFNRLEFGVCHDCRIFPLEPRIKETIEAYHELPLLHGSLNAAIDVVYTAYLISPIAALPRFF